MDNILIRPAEIGDLKTVQDLSHELFISDFENDEKLNLQWSFEENGENFFRERIMNKDQYLCLLAEKEGIAIGYLAAEICKDDLWRPITRAELNNLFVKQEFREHGVGGKLVKEFLSWAKGKGVTKASVTAYAKNETVEKFYKDLGFEEIFETFEAEIV